MHPLAGAAIGSNCGALGMVVIMRDMNRILVVAVLLSGCAGTWGSGEHSTSVRVANVTTASVAAAGMALDWCGTRHAAATRRDAWEGGMPASKVIGTSPSVGAVDAYFVIGSLAIAGAAQLVPERYRWLAYGAVATVEVYATVGNVANTRCGPLGTN